MFLMCDGDGVVHIIAAQENAIQVGALWCLDWYSSARKASDSMVEAAQKYNRRYHIGKPAYGTPTCIGCMGRWLSST